MARLTRLSACMLQCIIFLISPNLIAQAPSLNCWSSCWPTGPWRSWRACTSCGTPRFGQSSATCRASGAKCSIPWAFAWSLGTPRVYVELSDPAARLLCAAKAPPIDSRNNADVLMGASRVHQLSRVKVTRRSLKKREEVEKKASEGLSFRASAFLRRCVKIPHTSRIKKPQTRRVSAPETRRTRAPTLN